MERIAKNLLANISVVPVVLEKVTALLVLCRIESQFDADVNTVLHIDYRV